MNCLYIESTRNEYRTILSLNLYSKLISNCPHKIIDSSRSYVFTVHTKLIAINGKLTHPDFNVPSKISTLKFIMRNYTAHPLSLQCNGMTPI